MDFRYCISRSVICAVSAFAGLAFASPPPATSAPTGKHLLPVDVSALLKTFAGYVGIKEKPLGSNNGEMINKFNSSCGLTPSDHAPWCASVAHYGYLINGAGDRPGAYSPSWYRRTRAIPTAMVQPGDVGLIYFPSKGRYAHTIAAIERVNRAGRIVSSYTTLEGNTNAMGSREGDTFARRIRPADTVKVMRWTN